MLRDLAASTKDAVAAAMAKAPPWLPSKGPTILIRAGSHAAGVALPTSDVDLRGVVIAPKTSYLGFVHRFERFVSDAPDCEIQDLRRFFHEAAEGQPNALQVLFCHPEDIVAITDVGWHLRALARGFLSRRMMKPYLGYVKAMTTQVQRAAGQARVGLCHTEERLADLAKSTMHAVRLSRTVREVLDGEPLVIRRPDAADLLAVRGLRDVGEMGRVCAEIEGGIEGLWARSKTSSLPERPDLESLDRLCMELIEEDMSRSEGPHAS